MLTRDKNQAPDNHLTGFLINNQLTVKSLHKLIYIERSLNRYVEKSD